MNRVLPIQFHWHFDETEMLGIRNLRVRALPIFVNPEFQQLSIKRCPVHIMQDKFCGMHSFIYIYITFSRVLKKKKVLNCINLLLILF